MGALTSTPKIPQPQYITVAAPTPAVSAASVSANAAQNTTGGATEGTQSSEDTRARARESDLLNRRRGKFSTVLTGFRGILEQSTGNGARKTLLGE